MAAGPVHGRAEQKKILFVTAFKELGRERWTYYARRTDEYFEYFANLVQTLPHPLAVFIEDGLRARVQAVIDAAAASDRVTVSDYGSVDSFLVKYLERERAVMAAPEFRQLVARRLDCPETHNPEYTLVNHSKINFVRAAQTAQPDFDFYAWVDFGIWRSHETQIPRLDVNALPEKYIFNALKLPEKRIENDFKVKLEEWHERGIADDDQALLVQLYSEKPERFYPIVTGKWFTLFSELPRV